MEIRWEKVGEKQLKVLRDGRCCLDYRRDWTSRLMEVGWTWSSDLCLKTTPKKNKSIIRPSTKRRLQNQRNCKRSLFLLGIHVEKQVFFRLSFSGNYCYAHIVMTRLRALTDVPTSRPEEQISKTSSLRKWIYAYDIKRNLF